MYLYFIINTQHKVQSFANRYEERCYAKSQANRRDKTSYENMKTLDKYCAAKSLLSISNEQKL